MNSTALQSDWVVLLKAKLDDLDALHSQIRKQEKDVAKIDRDWSIMALGYVINALAPHGISSDALFRLYAELRAIHRGVKSSGMLVPPVIPHRPRDAPFRADIKGRLAAVMEYQQKKGRPRKTAAKWVADHVPQHLRQYLGGCSAATIAKWLTYFGGGRKMGNGRDGYLYMEKRLSQADYSDRDLVEMINAFLSALPSREIP